MRKDTVEFWKPNLLGGGIFLLLVGVGVLSGGVGLLLLPVMGLPAAISYIHDTKADSKGVRTGEFLGVLLFAGPFLAMFTGIIIIPFVLPVVLVWSVLTGKPLLEDEGRQRTGEHGQ